MAMERGFGSWEKGKAWIKYFRSKKLMYKKIFWCHHKQCASKRKGRMKATAPTHLEDFASVTGFFCRELSHTADPTVEKLCTLPLSLLLSLIQARFKHGFYHFSRLPLPGVDCFKTLQMLNAEARCRKVRCSCLSWKPCNFNGIPGCDFHTSLSNQTALCRCWQSRACSAKLCSVSSRAVFFLSHVIWRNHFRKRNVLSQYVEWNWLIVLSSLTVIFDTCVIHNYECLTSYLI